MKKFDEQKHFLALMKQPGNYNFIDISKLDIASGYRPQSLADIDSFTMHFTKEEIKKSINRANIISAQYIEGKLVIQDNQKHNPLTVLDKSYYDNFRIDLFLEEKMDNKNDTNKIIQKFNSIVREKEKNESFKFAILNHNLDLAVDILFNLEYLQLRKIMIYLIDLRNKEKNLSAVQELKRDKTT